ncbi:MAG: isocitrate lyase/PEP mutase family protein [Chloroflexi bacterium]|nr:MAG: isocitrate lyase/PEP mutase family protein [Chloroflexota bacterium]
MTTETPARISDMLELVPSALLPEGYTVPASRWIDPSKRMRELLDTEPFLFGPGVYDPQGAELAMYYGFKAVYFSGYSFAIGHLGTTDMDLYSGPEIADGARRTISALRKFQLTMAVGDPEKGQRPKHLEIPPVVVDMDGGYGNLFNVQRTTELYVTAGVAAAHLEDQVLPKRCGHIGGKALISADEMIGKLRMARAVAEDLGRPDFVVIARTDGVSAVDAPEKERGIELAIERALRYLAFNWSSSFKWFNGPDPITFAQLGELGYRFLFITLGAQHAMAHGLSTLLQGMSETQEQAYIELQRKEWAAGQDLPSKSHHFFSGVPYHQLVGESFGGSRLGSKFQEKLAEERVV